MTLPTIKYLRLFEDTQLPKRGSEHAACLDLFAYVANREVKYKFGFEDNDVDFKRKHAREYNGVWSITINPGDTALIPLGFKAALPEGWEAQIRPRSSASKRRIEIANSPGTIDSDFRGEWLVAVYNYSRHPLVIKHGEAIAQTKYSIVPAIAEEVVEDLDATNRGEGGFGSTGNL